jgi:hypothetical protein
MGDDLLREGLSLESHVTIMGARFKHAEQFERALPEPH